MLLHVVVAAVPVDSAFRNTPVQGFGEYVSDSIPLIYDLYYRLLTQ